MIPKPLLVPDIGADHLERRVAAVVFHLERAGTSAAGLGQKTGAEGVPGEAGRIVAGGDRPRRDHQRHALVTHRLGSQPALWCQFAECRFLVDAGNREPSVEQRHRLDTLAVGEGDGRALAFLIRLGVRDQGFDVADVPADVADLDRHQPERRNAPPMPLACRASPSTGVAQGQGKWPEDRANPLSRELECPDPISYHTLSRPRGYDRAGEMVSSAWTATDTV